MTYREWMMAMGSKFGMSKADAELILINQSALVPNADADVDVRTAKLAMCKEIAMVLPLANISEGGYSVSWNWEAVKLWYKSMCAELGIDDLTTSRPKIRNRSNIW